MSEDLAITSDNYKEFVADLKERIQSAKMKAALALNSELINLYWQIGRQISQKFAEEAWGAKVIDRLARDLNMKGYSPRNLQYMRAFFEAWPDELILQRSVAKLPWGHNCTLLGVKNEEERLWYVQQSIENGWSRDILALQIQHNLYERQGKSVNNFSQALPPPQSDLVRQVLKDPYNFEFLDLTEKAQERDIERSLTEHIREFLIELGAGFAFMGSQYHLEVFNRDIYLDLLFYHVKLRCYVVIDLKATDFEPEYVGKMNYYLSAVDDHLRHPDDQPSIGIILCKGRNSYEVEYALRGVSTPIGVTGYELALTKALPEDLKSSLPTVEELEAELQTITDDTEPTT